jgi:hypothetical protein
VLDSTMSLTSSSGESLTVNVLIPSTIAEEAVDASAASGRHANRDPRIAAAHPTRRTSRDMWLQHLCGFGEECKVDADV